MLDLQQALARNHLSSFSPVYQPNGSCVNTWTADFDFCGEQRTKAYEYNYDRSGHGGKVDFRAETQYEEEEEEEEEDDLSPRFWTSTSPLLPCNHHYSTSPSPNSRLHAILDGRRELVDMIRDLPESSYELSLKDIVDEKHALQEDPKDIVTEDTSLNFKPQFKIKPKKKKNCKRGQISRSESMDSGVFLLKIFFPTSLGLKRKSTAGNHSKVSPRRSVKGSDKTVDYKEWWKMRFLAIGEGKNSGRSSINGGSTSNSRSRQDDDDSNFTPGCWSFHKKCRSTRQKGRLL